MPQRPLRLTFGPSRSGLIHGQLAGGGFRGRNSEAWPHFSAPGAYTIGRTHSCARCQKRNGGTEQTQKRNRKNTIQKRIEQFKKTHDSKDSKRETVCCCRLK